MFCTVSDIKKCSVFLPLGEINAIYFRNKMDPSRFDLPLKDGMNPLPSTVFQKVEDIGNGGSQIKDEPSRHLASK